MIDGQSPVKRSIQSIDICKFLCALLVVGIHTKPLGDMHNGGGYLFTTITRVAVPFFFVCSSYLFFSLGRDVKRYVIRLVKLDIAWTVLEIPLIYYQYFVISEHSMIYNIFRLFQALLVGESYMGSWYIHASWMGMLIVWWMINNLKRWVILSISTICFLLAILDSSYRFVLQSLNIAKMWSLMDLILLPAESFIVAIPYFMLGFYLTKMEFIKKCNTNNKESLLLISVMVLPLIAESIACLYAYRYSQILMDNPRFEHFFMLIPVVCLMMMSCLMIRKTFFSNKIAVFIRNQSILVYLIHRPIMLFVYKLGIEPIGVVFYTITLLFSITFATLIIFSSKKIKALRYLY